MGATDWVVGEVSSEEEAFETQMTGGIKLHKENRVKSTPGRGSIAQRSIKALAGEAGESEQWGFRR